jgi:hypothetical protein
MGSINFLKYLNKFESEVICVGVKQNIIGKDTQVNVREGKLACSKYAKSLGSRVNSEEPFVIDYYGYLKRSNGFISLLQEEKDAIQNRQIKSIKTRVVFFASLKIEEIAEITSNQYLKGGFSEFKNQILHWRGFGQKKVMEEYEYKRTDQRS